jgi:hypothetical protein
MAPQSGAGIEPVASRRRRHRRLSSLGRALKKGAEYSALTPPPRRGGDHFRNALPGGGAFGLPPATLLLRGKTRISNRSSDSTLKHPSLTICFVVGLCLRPETLA